MTNQSKNGFKISTECNKNYDFIPFTMSSWENLIVKVSYFYGQNSAHIVCRILDEKKSENIVADAIFQLFRLSCNVIRILVRILNRIQITL